MSNHASAIKESFLLALIGLGMSGCLAIPENVKPVEDFEINRYLGKWYEIARLDHSFERGLSNVTADYQLRDGGGISVKNRGFNTKKEKWQDAVGKAFFVGGSTVGRLKVSFFGPFYGAYNIVGLDKESYQWSLVIGPDTGYFWILSRSKNLDKTTTDQLISLAASFGVDTDALLFVEHD